MARVFIDGFEAGDLNLWDTVGSSAAVAAAAAGMDGSYCLNFISGGVNYFVQKTLPSDDEYYFAFKYRPTNSGYSKGMISFWSGGVLIGKLIRTATTGLLVAYRGTTVIATGTAGIVLNTTYLIEVRFKPANAGGVFQVKIDGALNIDFSGDTTDGVATIDAVRLGHGDAASTNVYAYFDNLIVDTAAWIGNTKIQAIVPVAAGNSTQWAPSAGANYQCVDEKPPSEADYTTTNTTGHLDQFVAGDLTGSIENVKCVQVQALAKAEGAPTPTNLQLSVRTGGSDFLSGDKAIPVASKQLYELWEANPDTVAPWEISEINAMQIGVKAVA